MIQELLTGVVLNDPKFSSSIPSSLLIPSPSPSPSQSPSPSPSPSPSLPPSTDNHHRENLRCPRCDSSNTKFCYYNNYNLTQPRHFCKTCRRYWTKGGALRNVPIGGGCRKTKPSLSPSPSSSSLKSIPSKPKLPSSLDHDFSPNPLLWPSPSLTLLTSNPFPNPNPNPNPNNIFNLDFPTTTTTTNEVLFNANDQLQELYQRLRSSATTHLSDHHHHHHLHGFMGSSAVSASLMASSLSTPMVTTTSSSSTATIPTILESVGVSAGDFTYWNPTIAWSDLQTSNGAFP